MKRKITIYVDSEVMEALEKRAEKNHFSIYDQISNILRRSVVSSKKRTATRRKVDDKFLEYFSRHPSGRKRKKKTKKKAKKKK